MRLLKPALLALFMLCPWLLDAQVPVPQLNLSGNIGCIGFPCVNTGTFSITSDADTTLPITSTATSAFYLKVTSTVSLTATRKLNYPAGQFPVGIENATTGGQALSVCGPSGTCVLAPNSNTSYTGVWNDGTNFVQGFPANAVLGTGTTGDIPLWSGTGTLGNSPLSVSGGAIFDTGTFHGQDVCWHYEAGNTPQEACLRYAGHGNYYGPYNTNDGTTFTPTPFSVGQLNIGQAGATGVNGQAQAPSILFYENDTDATGPVAPVMATIAMYQAQPTGACPNAGVSGAVPVWGFAPDATQSFCTNAASSTWVLFSSGGTVLTGDVLKSSGSNATTIAAIEGTPVSLFQRVVNFGDSITVGAESSATFQVGYPVWLAKALRIPTANRNNVAVSGATSFSQDPFVFTTIFDYTTSQLLTEQIGTNNVASGAVTAAETAYQLSLQAHILWLETPIAQKYPFATSSAVTFTGTWNVDSDIGRSTATAGNTATFSGVGPHLHIETFVQNSSTAAASYSCDSGATTGTLVFTVAGYTLPQGGAQDNDITLGGGATTSHSCTITATTAAAGAQAVWIKFVTFLTGNSITTAPYLLEGQIPDRNPTDSVTPLYRASQVTAISNLAAEGITNLAYVITTGAVPTSAYNDNLHMTNLGYYDLSQPYVAEVNTLFTKAYTTGVFTPGVVADYSSGNGVWNMGLMFGAGISLTTGTENLLWGPDAGEFMTTAGTNVGIGTSSLPMCTTCTNNIAIGHGNVLGHLTTGGDNVAIGQSALFSATTTSQHNIAIGQNALGNGSGAFSNAIGMGLQAGYLNTGTSNLFMMDGAGYLDSGGGVVNAVTTDTGMYFIGEKSGKSTASILSDSGVFGPHGYIATSHSYEVGTGSCAGGFCFEGFSFLTAAGVGSFATGSTVNSSPICTTANGACSATSPLSGMTASQVPIAATATTVTSSKAIAGSGAGLTSGPTSATATDLPVFTSTTGGLVDSGVAIATLAPLASPALTGTPTAPTATVGTNTTQVATTAFVLANAGGSNVIITPTTVSCPSGGNVTVVGTKISTYDTEILILANSCVGEPVISYPAFTNPPSFFMPLTATNTPVTCNASTSAAMTTTAATLVNLVSGCTYAIKGW